MAPNVVQLVGPCFLDGISNSRSFIHALMGSSSSATFADLKPTSFRGLPSLWVSEEEVLALATPFSFSLVGYFSNHRLSLDAIRKFFFNLKLSGEFSVTLLDSRHVLIKLRCDMDYCCVFVHRSYFVNNCFMKLTEWSPFVDISEESPIVLVWVSFPNLRPHFFSPWILHDLGALFRHPLRTDNATTVGSQPSVARVLVELDITKRYPNKVWLGPEKYANAGAGDSLGNVGFPLHEMEGVGDEGRSRNVGNVYLEANQLTVIPSVMSPPANAHVVVEEEADVIVQDAYVSLNPNPIDSDPPVNPSLAASGMDVPSIDVGNSDANTVVNVETTHGSCPVVDGLKLDGCDDNKVILYESSSSLDSPLTSLEADDVFVEEEAHEAAEEETSKDEAEIEIVLLGMSVYLSYVDGISISLMLETFLAVFFFDF
ncbi:hypothetical protein M5K25_020313 [Dendrobium thyrsiflorum]|uniref:DUF4283 domain-containing protein n=1 Tax=Dendrobium thyrsiflorum TaxID=117978 RepID=A0ABD0UGL2_DENTH